MNEIIAHLYSANPTAKQLDIIQDHIGEVWKRHKNDDNLGADRYKMFFAQALVHFRRNETAEALAFLSDAFEIGGEFEGYTTIRDELLRDLADADTARHRALDSLALWSGILGPGIVLLSNLVATAAQSSSSTGSSSVETAFSLVALVSLVASIFVIRQLWIGVRELRTRSRRTALIIAAFFGPWTWVYSWRMDFKLFNVSLLLCVLTLGVASPIFWLWAIIMTASRDQSEYDRYPSLQPARW